MRTRTLLSQVLAVNTGLVAATAIVAAILAPEKAGDAAAIQRLLLIGLAVSPLVPGRLRVPRVVFLVVVYLVWDAVALVGLAICVARARRDQVLKSSRWAPAPRR